MSAPFYLAIDVGTSRTSAAIARIAPDGSPLASVVPLGRSSDNAPTVAFVAEGDVLFGDAAERRGSSQPDRLIREYKRRIGDDVPILAGDRAFAPEELYALTVDWAARAVSEREGATPVRLAITVPAAWGDHRSSLVRAALAAQGWRDVDILTEPEAAARHYEATNPLEVGRALAVYDFGGGTFDAVVLRKDGSDAVRIVGAPHGIADLGGADFDDTVTRHVIAAAKIDATTLAGDTAGRLALAALRRECVEAKESLSFDSEAVIPVILSGDQRTVRLTRDEFELMIEAELERTVAALEDGFDDAGVSLDDVDAILLTGGSSRIPRVAQLLSERFDRPIAIDTDPKAIIALGAARASVDAVIAAQVAAPGDEEDEDEDALATLLGEPSATPARKRSWFRKVPPTAYVAGAFAVLLTGVGIASAPALGSGALDPVAAKRLADNQLGLPGDVYGPPLPAAPVAVTDEVAPAAAAAPPAEQQSANPRRSSRTPTATATETRRSTPRSQAASPTGGGTAASNSNQSSPSSPNQQASPPSSPPSEPSTPPSNPGTPPTDPSTPPTDPSTPPTDPSTPPAEPSTPPPADPPATEAPATSDVV